MWTPKRLVLLACGFVFFLSGYLVFAMSPWGGIDGLPPLPESYTQKGVDLPTPVGPRGLTVAKKITQAFGEGCPELVRPIRLDMHAKNMVLAADQFQIEPDGRLCLTPLSVAMFGKKKGDGPMVDINTVRSQVAYITFDRPLANINEISGRKIVGMEVTGNIEITNNRHTLERDDDLYLFIPTGPLYYQESNQVVWTNDTIHLVDHQSKPKPVEVRGKGMEMDLAVEHTPGPPGRKGKNEQITGVKRIVLHSNVDMHLFIDGKSGFMGKPKPPSGRLANGQPLVGPEMPPEKDHVAIKTPGKFQYDLLKDHDEARFDVPEGKSGTPAYPVDVTVTRYHEAVNKLDQLVCQHLELRLRRKEKPAGAAREDDAPDHALDIETAHATGPEVTLTSDAESLEAFGNDFFYDARKLTTTLKGDPQMRAFKEGNTIRARELEIQDQKLPAQPGLPPRSFQQMTAKGPVYIDLVDKSASSKKPVQASCTETLISTKDGPHDLLILSGSARFLDEEHHQHLQADVLKVWLNPNERDGVEKPVPAKPAAAGAEVPGSGGRKPHHIEATGNVLAWSPEMNIHDTSRLVVWFKDVPAASLPEPRPKDGAAAPAAGKEMAPATAPEGKELHSAQRTPTPDAVPATGAAPAAKPDPAPIPAPGTQPAKSESSPRPIDLSARRVEAWVLRSPDKNQLDKLWTEGSVQVKQDPAKPDEKGVDIKGETLEMNYHIEGNFLVVTGDLAQLRMDKIYILGPEVNIDQAANKAWVNGIGAMQMESATNFQGDKLDKATPLTVHWNKSMLFNGKFAEFHGGIQAEQDKARLAGQSLTVFFDRPISLKEGNKGEPAKVQNLMVDRDVRVEDSTFEGTKLVRYQRLIALVVNMTALEADDDNPQRKESASQGNEVYRTSGPGNLRIMQHGDDPANGPGAPAPQPKTKPAGTKTRASASPEEEKEMKLTYVQFFKSMYANSKTNTAIFLENVRVLHLPCDDPNLEIDLDLMLDKLPEGAMYLRSDRLDVFNRGTKGHSQQEMLAKGRCIVQAKEYWGRAHTVTFNEAKDQIIFEGDGTNLAELYKVPTKGARPQEIRARKIIYIRKTGEFSTSDTNSLRSD